MRDERDYARLGQWVMAREPLAFLPEEDRDLEWCTLARHAPPALRLGEVLGTLDVGHVCAACERLRRETA